MAKAIQDPILRQIKSGIEAKIPADMKRDYLAVVTAGLKLMYSDETHHFMQEFLDGVKAKGEDPKAIAQGIVKLATVIQNESKRPEIIPAIFPAALVLMCYALEDLEKAHGVDFSKEQVSEITKLVMFQLMKVYKIDPKQIHQAVQTGVPKPGQEPVAQEPAAPTAPPGGGLLAQAEV
ncbi:MAG: hypothetical protein Q7R68_11040 [Nitrospirales bacterium]|nr:hypothetical protein [Nitrospirales bacterium]